MIWKIYKAQSRILLLLLCISCSACFKLRMSEKKILRKFKDQPLKPRVAFYTLEDRAIRYVEIGDSSKPLVIFVHGAPGSATNFLNFFKDPDLLSRVRMISVDRPGYGYSGFGRSVISIQRQAAMLRPLLDLNQNPCPPILVGHSFGAPIIARMAMDYPEQVGPLVMAAPAIDPDHERIFWVSYPADWGIFKWSLPKIIRVTNEEKLSHVAELEKMRPLWQNIRSPSTFIHGYKDRLVPIQNSKFGQNMLSKAPVKTIYLGDLNHLIPWKRPDLIKQAVLEYLIESETIGNRK